MKKTLSVREAVERAAFVFDMNAETQGVLKLGETAGLCSADASDIRIEEADDPRSRFLWEWRGFAHAAVFNGLMEHAPGVTVLEYLRMTSQLMQRYGYNEAQSERFTDTSFKSYSDAFINKKASDCPRIFFERFSETPLASADKHAAAVISGTMAMLVAAVLDTFEKYSYLTD